MSIVPVATASQRLLAKTKSLWTDYSYARFVDKYDRHFVIAGCVGGALYPIVTSRKRNTFEECVYSTAFHTTGGFMAGIVAVYLHPVWMAGLVLGGPMWVSQRIRFSK